MILFFARKNENPKHIAVEQQTAQGIAMPVLHAEQTREEEGVQKPLTKTDIQQQARRDKRKIRYDEVMKLHERGVSQVAIAKMLDWY